MKITFTLPDSGDHSLLPERLEAARRSIAETFGVDESEVVVSFFAPSFFPVPKPRRTYDTPLGRYIVVLSKERNENPSRTVLHLADELNVSTRTLEKWEARGFPENPQGKMLRAVQRLRARMEGTG